MELIINRRSISSLNDLMSTISRLIDYEYKGKVKFVAAYPSETTEKEIALPIITYRLRRKEPGYFSNSKGIKPRCRETIVLGKTTITEDDDGSKIGYKDKDGNYIELTGGSYELWGQMFDHYVEFEIWADNNKEVEYWSSAFEKFLFKYTGYVKVRGVSEILYQFREELNQESKWRTDLKSSKIEYLFRIDEVTGVRISEVERILMEVDIVDSSSEIILHVNSELIGIDTSAYKDDVISYEM